MVDMVKMVDSVMVKPAFGFVAVAAESATWLWRYRLQLGKRRNSVRLVPIVKRLMPITHCTLKKLLCRS